jgi:hypothetical protein
MSNSQQGMSNIQGWATKGVSAENSLPELPTAARLDIPCWLLDIQIKGASPHRRPSTFAEAFARDRRRVGHPGKETICARASLRLNYEGGLWRAREAKGRMRGLAYWRGAGSVGVARRSGGFGEGRGVAVGRVGLLPSRGVTTDDQPGERVFIKRGFVPGYSFVHRLLRCIRFDTGHCRTAETNRRYDSSARASQHRSNRLDPTAPDVDTASL